MIGKFFKEYRLWLGLYTALVVCFVATFWLYQLPLLYFANALLFAGTLFLVVATIGFVGFYQKMTRLTQPSPDKRPKWSSPLMQAVEEALEKDVLKAQQAHESSQQDLVHLKGLIKMWSHQIKVPLASLDLMTQTETLEPQKVAQQLQSTQHYLDLLLNYLKFQDKTDDYRFEPLRIAELVTQIIKGYRIQCVSKDLSVQLIGDWELVSDKKWLSFALGQLIDNAIKYSKPGGKLMVEMTDKKLVLSDQGIGILPEDLPRLFDEGFTSFNGHQYHKSTGLGLYMAKTVLDRLELSITITSQIDQGTQVTLTPKERKT